MTVRRSLGSVVFVLAASLGLLSFQALMLAFFGMVVVGIFALYAVVRWGMVLFVHGPERAVANKAAVDATRFAGLTLLLVGCWFGGYLVRLHRAESAFVPVIEAAETYRTAHGRYPANAGEFSPELLGRFSSVHSTPLPEGGEVVRFETPRVGFAGGLYSLQPRAGKDGFHITFMTFGFMHHTYASEERGWYDWD